MSNFSVLDYNGIKIINSKYFDPCMSLDYLSVEDLKKEIIKVDEQYNSSFFYTSLQEWATVFLYALHEIRKGRLRWFWNMNFS